MKKPRGEVIQGGCACGFWSAANCAYVRKVKICQASIEKRPIDA